MSAFVTSDLHLGHKMAAEKRGFDSVEQHDECIIDNLHDALGKRDKLFILGDIAWSPAGLAMLGALPCTMDAVLGNHDQFQVFDYAMVFNKVYGIVRYKKLWLSHCPIHPQEMYRCRGNVHGHIHKGTESPELPLPYFNVNVDFHDMKPVAVEDIKSIFDNWEAEL